MTTSKSFLYLLLALDVLIDNSLRINVNVTILLPFLMVYVKLVWL